MSDFSNIDKIDTYIEPYVFTDELSDITKYTGMSASFADANAPNWRIKKEWKIGNVTYMGFPSGD